MLSALMLDVLNETSKDKLLFPCSVVADYLQDIWSHNKEAMCYETKFRRAKVTLNDVIGVLMKFGNKHERKVVGRCMRHKISRIGRGKNKTRKLMRKITRKNQLSFTEAYSNTQRRLLSQTLKQMEGNMGIT